MTSLKRTLAKLAVLAMSASPAAAAPGTTDCNDCELDASNPIDRDGVDPRVAGTLLGNRLADALAEMKPLDATHLVTTWALSTDRLRRFAVVTALARVAPLGTRSVLAHLALDPDPDIRAAAHQLTATT